MKKRFTEEQIIGFLKQAEAGVPVKELCRKHGSSDAAFYTRADRTARLDGYRQRSLRRVIACTQAMTPHKESFNLVTSDFTNQVPVASAGAGHLK